MSEKKDNMVVSAEEAVDSLINSYNNLAIQIIEAVNAKLEIDTYISEQKERIAAYNIRDKDIKTLYCIKDLMEAQVPAEAQVGEETKYLPVFDDKDRARMNKTVMKILQSIHREYIVVPEQDKPDN